MKVRFPPLEEGDLGTDVALTDDFAPVWGLASGKINLAMALYRRFTTDTGDLFYDRKYGFNLRNLVNMRMDGTKLGAARSSVIAQSRMDERVQSASVSFVWRPELKALDIGISVETATGTFVLVMRATSATVDILTIDGVPLPEPIRPDLLAAIEIPDEAAIVFPDAPPAIGHLSGRMSIGFTAHGFLKQPVGEWMAFSGCATAGGGAESHADFGATTTAPTSSSLTRYLMPACSIRNLRLKPVANTRTVATTFEVYKNGTATGLQVSVAALSTAAATSGGTVVTCNGTTDVIALVSSGSPTGTVTFGATLETGLTKVLKFSGRHTLAGGDVNVHADIAGAASGTTLNSYIPAACTVSGLRICPVSNGSAIAAVTFTLYKNGAPTSLTVTVPAGSTAPQVDSNVGHAVTFNGTTDTLDLVSSRTGGSPADDVQLFTTAGPTTWVKPLGAATTTAFMLGAGGGTAGSYTSIGGIGGGTGGGMGAHPTSAPGGAGGGGAQLDTYDATTMPATVPVFVGPGGLAGTPSTDGGIGGASSFWNTYATGGDGSPHAGSFGVETGIGGNGGTGNAGIGGRGGLGGNSADGREATAGGVGTGRAAGGGGGGAGNLSNITGGNGGASGAGYAGGVGGIGSGDAIPAGAGTDRSADSDPFARAGSGGGGGGASAGGGFSDYGGHGAAGGRYGGGAGAPGVCANGKSLNGTAGPDGYVVAVTTIRAGDLAFGATLELT